MFALQKIFALLLIITIGISGCTTTNAARPNQLALGELSDPATFNIVLNNVATDFFRYTSESLITTNGKGEIEPALAESWQIDGNTITFTLRPNLKWSDGIPLTVDDVEFSFNEAYFNPKIPNSTQDILKIGKSQQFPTVKKIDAQRIAITTPEPFAPALRSIGGQGIIPAHKLRASTQTTEDYPEQEEVKDQQGKKKLQTVIKQRPKFMGMWGINTKPSELVSNGMYRLVSYTPGERMIFERNPYYWRKDATGRQLPYIDRVVSEISENTDNLLMQFRSGNVDTYKVTPEFFSLLKKEEKKGNFTINNLGPSTGNVFLAFNLNKGSRDGKPLVETVKSKWFNNIKFRQASAYAIDRNQMVNNLFRGLGVPQNSPISIGTPYFLQEGLKSYNYDLEKAKSLLKEAGFKYKGNELYDEEDNRVEFNLITNSGNKIREAIGSQIKQDLGKLGMKVNFNPVAFALLIDKLDKALDWDAHIIGFTGGIDPHDGANFWLTEGRSHLFNQKPSKEEKQITGQEVSPWEKEINDLYIRGSQELDEAKRKEIYYQTQKITQENLPCIYLATRLNMYATRNTLKGLKSTSLDELWNLHEVSIER
jgi:peptide/nickel transport system substrate-binding protein